MLISNENSPLKTQSLYNNIWGTGSQSKGNGFQNWSININNTNYAGVFIGNPVNDGINNSLIGDTFSIYSTPEWFC